MGARRAREIRPNSLSLVMSAGVNRLVALVFRTSVSKQGMKVYITWGNKAFSAGRGPSADRGRSGICRTLPGVVRLGGLAGVPAVYVARIPLSGHPNHRTTNHDTHSNTPMP